MAEKPVTGRDVWGYVNTFKENQRDNVLRKILEVDILEKFLATTDGRLLLNSVVDRITDETMRIVSLAVAGGATAEIEHAALKINLAYDFMKNLATIAAEGGKHKENLQTK